MGDTGYHVGLSFVERFNLETSNNCEKDYVQVWQPSIQRTFAVVRWRHSFHSRRIPICLPRISATFPSRYLKRHDSPAIIRATLRRYSIGSKGRKAVTANGRVSARFAAGTHLRPLTRRRTAWRWFSIRTRRYSRTVSAPSGAKIAAVFSRRPRRLRSSNRRRSRIRIRPTRLAIIPLSRQTKILSSSLPIFSWSAVSHHCLPLI